MMKIRLKYPIRKTLLCKKTHNVENTVYSSILYTTHPYIIYITIIFKSFIKDIFFLWILVSSLLCLVIIIIILYVKHFLLFHAHLNVGGKTVLSVRYINIAYIPKHHHNTILYCYIHTNTTNIILTEAFLCIVGR